MAWHVVAAFVAAWAAIAHAHPVRHPAAHRPSALVPSTISNVQPRRDVNGAIMDIHDGDTLALESHSLYFYYGASYGLCEEPQGANGCSDAAVGACGFRLDHNVSLFTSPDLVNWTPHPHIFEMANHPEPGILYCPKMLYNRNTNKYVMWYNWLPSASLFAVSLYGVAISDSPFGPFAVVNTNVTLANDNTGDLALFVDPEDADATAYIIYTAHIQGYAVTHQMSIERLDPTYTGSTLVNSGFFGASFVEAPTLFARNGSYYALFGQCCCYCQAGSPVSAYRSTSGPLGPYVAQNGGAPITSAIDAQQTNAYRVRTHQHGDDGQLLWQGDRWQSAPDGLKGHDFSYWGEMQFDGDGNILPLDWQDSFTFAVLPP